MLFEARVPATILALSGLLACLPLTNGSDARAAEPVVIVLSWDGVRHDYPDRTELPGLERLAREGARADHLQPVFPASTFPNHVSLATGTYPDRHGIVDNRFLDPERGLYSYSGDATWLQAEPLWAAAERQGVRSAAYFWVGSETDWSGGPGASLREAPFDSEIGEGAKVDRLLEWLSLPEPERPRLLMSWWHGADGPGHAWGPDTSGIAESLRAQDAELQRLLAGLDERDAWGHTTLFIVSDHGMTEVGETVDLIGEIEAAGVSARVEPGSTVAHVFVDDPADLDAAEAALSRLPGASVYRRDALPPGLRIGHPTRSGDLVVFLEPPKTFRPAGWRGRLVDLVRTFGYRTGGHGYRPELPEMGAIFYALGRGVEPGTALGTVRAIDLAPTVAALLGISPPAHSEGVAISGIGAPTQQRP